MAESLEFALEELLPHDHPMILIDSAWADSTAGFSSSVRISEDSAFFEPSRGVPSYVGIEYIAQTVAALVGLESRRAGKEVRLGYLLGTRRFQATVSYFTLGERLTTRVAAEFESGGLAKYRGEICNDAGKRLVETSVTLYSGKLKRTNR